MITLTADPSCRYQMTWAVAVIAGDANSLIQRISASSRWKECTRALVLKQFVHTDGHELLFVPATGRIQIRLHYLVARSARKSTASALEVELSSLGESSRDEI